MSYENMAVHPGEILLNKLKARGLKKMSFARQMKMANSSLSDIIHGKKGVTEDIARRLEELLGISAEYCH